MGMGQNINAFTPYMPPQIGFGNISSFGLNQNKETAAEAEERRKKLEAEKASKEFLERLKKIQEAAENAPKIKEQINNIEKNQNELSKVINRANNGKLNTDGTIKVNETWEDYNKLPWWKKTLRGASHFLQGTLKLATGFIGYETDPKTGESKWNWKKCLKNTAIAAGCIALTAIPYVGPFISAGLLATGVACGTYETGKGVIKAINAKTPEELDYAWQDIGAGTAIGITSALGVRGLGKGMRVSPATGSTTEAAAANTTLQSVKNSTIGSAYKATVQAAKTDKANIAANGFFKTYGAKLKDSFVPKMGKSRFENAKYETHQQINSRLNEISKELQGQNISPFKKALLEREQMILEAQKAELRNTVTKDGWKMLRTDSKLNAEAKELQGYINELKINGTVDINGKVFSQSNENIAALKQAVKRSNELSKQVEKLAKVRSATIKQMALLKKHKAEVEAYTAKTRNNRFGRLYDAARISKSDISAKKAVTVPLKLAWNATMIPFKPWNHIQNSSTSTFYKIEETVAPMYEAGFLDSFMGFGGHVMTTKVVTKNEKGEAVQQEIAVTKDVLAQLKEQKNQLDKALSDAQTELNKLNYA